MSATVVVARQEKPLSGVAKAGLMTGLAGLNLLFYLFGIFALLWIGLLILIDLALLVALLRFYAGRVMLPPLQRLARLSGVLIRSFRLEEGVKFHMALQEADAPHLFATVRDCARRVGCPMPSEIVLEIGDGAWVLLEGMRSGRGKSTLGLGQDMLATLPQAELEAVLLHEMAHALRVQRGLKKWAVRGLMRGGQLGEAAEEAAYDAGRNPDGSKSGTRFWTARIIAWIAGRIGRAEAKLFAAYSRQDEFEADGIAAQIAGAQTFCNALLHTHMIGIKSGSIHWQERLMQSQREDSYTQWLQSRLLPKDVKEVAELQKQTFESDRRSLFSTHPSLPDRLAHIGADFRSLDAAAAAIPLAPAMPATPYPAVPSLGLSDSLALEAGAMPFVPPLPTKLEEQATSTTSASSEGTSTVFTSDETAPTPWFADTDAIAERLITVIERVEGEEESKHSEELLRDSRRGGTSLSPTGTKTIGLSVGMLGVVLLIAGLIAYTVGSHDDEAIALAVIVVGVVAIAGGIAMFRSGAPIPPAPLPIPEFKVWEESLEAIWERQSKKQHAPVGGSVIPGPPIGTRKPDALKHWRDRGYEALLRCDYPSALACGQQCLALQGNHADGMLLAGIGYNALGQETTGDALLSQAVKTFGKDVSTQWAAAWVSLMAGDWPGGERFLLQATDTSKHPTLLGALAMAQSRRGKSRSAITALGQAVALEPDSSRLRLRLAQTLLLAGKARESTPHLEILSRLPEMMAERDVRLALVRMHLMRNHVAEADIQAQAVEREHSEPESWLRLGISYYRTDHTDRAEAYFHRATAQALYPAAWIYLASIYAERKRVTEAHSCYLGAINLLAPRVTENDKPMDALEAALQGIRSLRAPVSPLFPWAVTLDLRSLPAFGLSLLHLLVLAPNRAAALGYVNEVYTAMYPGAPPLDSVVRSAEKTEIEPPDEATEPGIVDWRAIAL